MSIFTELFVSFERALQGRYFTAVSLFKGGMFLGFLERLSRFTSIFLRHLRLVAVHIESLIAGVFGK